MSAQKKETTTSPPAHLEENDLIHLAIHHRDHNALEQIIRNYYPVAHRFTYRILLNHQAAEDATQETFLRIAKKIHTFKQSASFKSWLFRIAHNCATDQLRLLQKQRKVSDSLEEHLPPEPHTPSTNHHLSEEIHHALSQLPEKLRSAIALVYLEDLSHKEAAQILKCAETTISWRIHTAKKKLQKLLQPSP